MYCDRRDVDGEIYFSVKTKQLCQEFIKYSHYYNITA